MEDWTDVMYINMLGCNAYGYKPAGAFCYGFHNFPGNYRYYGAANINDGVLTDYCSKTATATAGVTSLYRGCAAIPDEFITNPELWPDKQWKGMTAAGLFIFFIVIAGLVVMSLFIGKTIVPNTNPTHYSPARAHARVYAPHVRYVTAHDELRCIRIFFSLLSSCWFAIALHCTSKLPNAKALHQRIILLSCRRCYHNFDANRER